MSVSLYILLEHPELRARICTALCVAPAPSPVLSEGSSVRCLSQPIPVRPGPLPWPWALQFGSELLWRPRRRRQHRSVSGSALGTGGGGRAAAALHGGCSAKRAGRFPLAPRPSRPAPAGEQQQQAPWVLRSLTAPWAFRSLTAPWEDRGGQGVTPLRWWVLAEGPRCRAVRAAGSPQGLSSAGASSGPGQSGWVRGGAVPGRVLPGTGSSRFSAARRVPLLALH